MVVILIVLLDDPVLDPVEVTEVGYPNRTVDVSGLQGQGFINPEDTGVVSNI